MLKKIISLIICLSLFFGIFSVTAQANSANVGTATGGTATPVLPDNDIVEIPDNAKTFGAYTYIITDSGVTILRYDTTATGEVVIPTTIDDYPVTKIGDKAFWGCESITSLTLNDGLISIGKQAFRDCSALLSVTFSASVESVGEYAFDACENINSLEITELGNWCEIEFENYISNPTYICDSFLLNGEEISEITIPGNVTQINDYAFFDCKNITKVIAHSGVTRIGESAFYRCQNLVTLEGGAGIIEIGEDAFMRSAIKNITLGNNLQRICGGAFNNCWGLTGINVPKSVTYMGYGAFTGCFYLARVDIEDLSSFCSILFDDADANPIKNAKCIYIDNQQILNLILPEGITAINKYVFYGCTSLQGVTFPKSLITVGFSSFQGCTGVTEITFIENITEIHDFAIADCSSLHTVSVLNPNCQIGSGFVKNCSALQSINLPTNMSNIGRDFFSGCPKLKNIEIPQSVAYIGQRAFKNTAIESLTLPTSISVIESDCFNGCQSLTQITIPSSVTQLRDNSFANCILLQKVVIPESVTYIDSTAFENCHQSFTIHGYLDSTAQTFAITNNINFVSLGCGNHNYVNGSCSSCGTACLHESYSAYKCTECGMACTHSFKLDTCSKCGYVCKCTSLSLSGYQAPTCNEPGFTGHLICNDCGIISEWGQTIPTTECEKFKTVGVVAATCKSAGYTGDLVCTVCETTKQTGTTVCKKQHTKTTILKAATTSISGEEKTVCSVCEDVFSTVTIPKIKSIKLAKTTYTYTGKAIKPGVKVNGVTLKEETDYTAVYSKNKNAGKASVKITLKGKYSGTKTLTFKINPKATKISSLKAGKKAFTVKYSKQTSGSGYEIQYSTSSKFKSAKTVKITKNKTVSKTVKKLKAKKTYYVRVRVVKGSYKSAWSKALKVKTK